MLSFHRLMLVIFCFLSTKTFSNELGGKLGIGIIGKVLKFQNDETWAGFGVVFNDRYLTSIIYTEDGEALEIGLQHEYNRLGTISSSIHINIGLIRQVVHTGVDPLPEEFNGYYSTVGINYTFIYLGARLLRRDIKSDLLQRRGRTVSKSADDFYVGVGIHFSP